MAAVFSICLLLSSLSQAQIGGKFAADGPVVIDDAEGLDLRAEGVERDWISDYLYPSGYILSPLGLIGSGLTAAAGQTSIGCLKAEIPEKHRLGAYEGYINSGFGVPMPSVAGQSTEPYPGNISSFQTLSFYACYEPVLSNMNFSVVLETYPGPDYPKIHWDYAPVSGKSFNKVTINLRTPSLIENQGNHSLVQLLSQTRFLYFHAYAGPVPLQTKLRVHMDDFKLEGYITGVNHWQKY